MKSWNPVLNLFKEVKAQIKEPDYRDSIYINPETHGRKNETCFERWCRSLGNRKYIDFISQLQFISYGNLLLIRYGIDSFKTLHQANHIYRECRSLVIDMKTEELILTPMAKFFNVNEVKETEVDNLFELIKTAKIVEFSDKLDGSMVSARNTRDRGVILSTSMALDQSKSWRLAKSYKYITEEILTMIRKFPDYTFIFEMIDKGDRKVVNYKDEEDGLYLIGIRSILTGEELCYGAIIGMAKRFNVNSTLKEDITLEKVLEKMQVYKANEKEGWVMNIDGFKVKLKCDDYCNIHKFIAKQTSVNAVIRAIADGVFDDMYSKVQEEYKERVMKIATLVFDWQEKHRNRVWYYVGANPMKGTKASMFWFKENVPKEVLGDVKSAYLEREWHPLKKKSGRYLKFSNLYDKPLEELL